MAKEKKRIVLRKKVDRGESDVESTGEDTGGSAFVSTAPTATATKPKAKASDVLEPWEVQLHDRLRFIRDYHKVSIPQFRNFTGLGTDARAVIDQYVAQNLLVRTWERSTGYYSLTDAGNAKLDELAARNG